MTEDRKRICDLVFGRTVQRKRGLPQQVYLEEGSDEELEARRALARELRKSIPLDLGLRFAIADMIDPDCHETERRIRLGYRRKGQPRQAYLQEDSAEDLEHRRAFVRQLRKSSPRRLRLFLADMIDPDRDNDTRRIQFRHRRKGKRSNAIAEKEVAEFIWSKTRARGQMEAALIEATEKFGLKRARLHKIWRVWHPILKRAKRTKPINDAADLMALYKKHELSNK